MQCSYIPQFADMRMLLLNLKRFLMIVGEYKADLAKTLGEHDDDPREFFIIALSMRELLGGKSPLQAWRQELSKFRHRNRIDS